jgi:hypothetical protein
VKFFLNFIIFFFKLPKFFFDFFIFYKKNNINSKYSLKPMLFDIRNKEPFDPHYLYHTAWACRVLSKIKPKIHYDFSSDLRFVTMVSSFIKTVQYNLTIPTIKLTNLKFRTTNLTDMRNIETNSLKSVSCMHVVEHIGLGRYGDSIDPNADKKAIKEIIRILMKGGNLLFVTPIGINTIYFNAHRVRGYEEVIRSFSSLKLIEFAFIDDNGFFSGIQINPNVKKVNTNKYGCGCFWFKKI